MAKKKEVEEVNFKVVNGYHLVNAEKLDRAINGTVMSLGALKGGAGQDAEPEEVLAEYDRLGGLILKDGKYKVKTGSFYDFKHKEMFEDPEPVLVFTVNGETVEVSADEPLPMEVRAAQQADEKKQAKRKKAAAASDAKKEKNAAKKKKKNAKEDTEEEAEDEAEDDADAEGDGELA
jgi:5-deoxy-D-glucuronate isomerase